MAMFQEGAVFQAELLRHAVAENQGVGGLSGHQHAGQGWESLQRRVPGGH